MDTLKLVTDAKDREIALILEARDARESALQMELQAARREVELLKGALTSEVALRGSASAVKGAVEEALREERARLAEQAAAAQYQQDQRRLWLRSPDCVLQVLCVVAMNGHDARGFANLTRAFRGDVVLWGCIKDRPGRDGSTVLMACAAHGDLARVRWLLERGANVNAETYKEKWTPLMWACAFGHLSVVSELLERGADVNTSMEYGWTSLMEACHQGHLEVVRELLERGANVNAAQTDDGCTSLQWACSGGHLEVVKELLKQGANVNATKMGSGQTALMSACETGHLGIVRELLGKGADANAVQTDDGWTSLMFACWRGHLEVARLLLLHHASKGTLSLNGGTAYKFAPKANAELRALVKP